MTPKTSHNSDQIGADNCHPIAGDVYLCTVLTSAFLICYLIHIFREYETCFGNEDYPLIVAVHLAENEYRH